MRKCPKCNAEIMDRVNFCSSCGEEIIIPNDVLNDNTNNVTTKNSITKSLDNKTAKQTFNKKLIIVSIIISIVFLIIGCLIGFGLSNVINNKNTLSTESSTTIKQADNTESFIIEYLEKADAFIEQEEYDEAIASLETAIQLYGENEDILSKINKTQKLKGLQQLDTFENETKYKEAIEYIDNDLSNFSEDTDIMSKRNLFVTNYRQSVLDNAEKVFEDTGCVDAINILEDGLQILPDDTEFTNKINEYKEYYPVSMRELTVTAKNGYGWYDTTVNKDPRGNVNSNAIELGYYVEFYTGGNYSKLTATIDPSEYFSKNGGAAKLKIYADDILIYTSDTITFKSDDIPVKVDINNAQYISFKIEDESKYSYSTVDLLICNPEVSK